MFSMTGFGKAEARFQGIDISVEVKTVNNRFLETTLRIPRELSEWELEYKEQIQTALSRGSVYCTINLQGLSATALPTGIHKETLEAYIQVAQQITALNGVSGDLDVNKVIQMNEIIQYSKRQDDLTPLAKKVALVLNKALKAVISMRKEEGKNLRSDLELRIKTIKSNLEATSKLLPLRQKEVSAKLSARIQNLMNDRDLDETRLIQEASILADKLDVTEEIVRFNSHNQIFLATLKLKEPIGKKLNFLLQEMGREANTLATKSQYAEMQHIAVSLKEEIEIIREQVQNIE